jgi:predicted RNase H-like nuclease (RuvC/YqgF family)
MTTTTTNNIEELANEVANLQEEISNLNYRLKSDLTGWNIVEAIENLSFELKRLNDREEQKK